MSAGIYIDDDVTSWGIQDVANDISNLEGQLSQGQADGRKGLSSDYHQLDEPILDTLLRDLTGIYNKMKIVALPLSSYDIYKIVLRGWDLWGPLMLCTFLAFELHHPDHNLGTHHTGPQFAGVFVLVWFGSCMVSLNYRLLSVSSVNNRQTSNQVIFSANATSQGDYQPHVLDGQDRRQQPDAAMAASGELPHKTLVSPPSILQLMCVFGYCLVAPCVGLIILRLFSFQRLIFERVLVGMIFGFAWPTYCSVRILVRYQHPSKRVLAIYPMGLFYFVLSCMIILSG